MASSLAALWFTRLVVGLSSQKLRFDPRLVDLEFVEDKLALGQGFLRVLQLPPVNIISLKLHTHLWAYNRRQNSQKTASLNSTVNNSHHR